jgi:predicted O-linked N-acetylglucosamine transferase (SPINDLY family)
MSLDDSTTDLRRKALACQARGDWSQACLAWDAVLRTAPADAHAHANRAACQRRLGREGDARAGYEAALQIDPAQAAVWFNYANLLQAGNDAVAAERAFRRALELQPRHVPALVNLGRLLRDNGRLGDAETILQRAVELEPAQRPAHRMLARLLQQRQRWSDARVHYEAALAMDADDPALRSDYGLLLNQLGQPDDARRQWLQLVDANPHDVAALNNLGALARQRRRADEALQWLERAHALRPDDPLTTGNLAQALSEQGQTTRARRLTEACLRLHPQDAGLHLVAGLAQVNQGDIEQAVDSFLAAVERAPTPNVPVSNALFASLYRDDSTPEADLALHGRWARRLPVPVPSMQPPCAPLATPRTALRVGFVSPDFRSHPVACFFAPLLPHFNRERLEIVCYSTAPAEDEVTALIRGGAHHWRSAASWSDEALAAQIRDDRCDVLVDLAGHTALNRLGVFRARPAPVQLTYMGYPATTGVPEIDGLIGDDMLLPAGTEAGFSERLLRLDRPWICYAPTAEAPGVASSPALQNGYISFGSFNNYPKLSEATIRLWSRALLAVPQSRLCLRALALSDAGLRERLPQRFERHGVDPRRILALPPVAGQAAALDAYRDVDIALDTVPFNGFTTTCDALWMGVPVIALEGDTYRRRVSATILRALGEPACIAGDAEQFVAIARRLAADPASLARDRASRRARFQASPLGDARSLASALTTLFERVRRERASDRA